MNPAIPQTIYLSERFHSIQGEGHFTGTPMHFVRTSGCNVGRHPDNAEVQYEIGQDRDFPILKTGTPMHRCHTHDGRGFWCDTDFTHGEPCSFDEILDDTWEQHLCLTGGEPLLHRERLEPFLKLAENRGIMVHLETSGTIDWSPSTFMWITCCPKQGYHESMITLADEIKLIVDPGFKIEDVPPCIIKHPRVYLQPLNEELTVNQDNLKLAYELLRIHPDWGLSLQIHKLINWR